METALRTRAADNCAGGSPYLNSRLSARTASFAAASFAEARSQTSNTRAQSSEAVAVR